MKYLLFIISLFILSATYGQAIPQRGSSYQDSVRASAESGKIIMVNGAPVNTAMDFIENLTAAKSDTIFLNALRKASMFGTMKSRGPLTLLLPPDSNIKSQLAARLDTLMKPTHKYELINLLSYHVLPGRFTIKDITARIKDGNGTASLLTLAGSKITATVDANRNIVLQDENGGKSVISRFNIEESNGIMHLLTQVLIPKDRAM